MNSSRRSRRKSQLTPTEESNSNENSNEEGASTEESKSDEGSTKSDDSDNGGGVSSDDEESKLDEESSKSAVSDTEEDTPSKSTSTDALSPKVKVNNKDFITATKFMKKNTTRLKLQLNPSMLIFQAQLEQVGNGKWANLKPRVNHNTYRVDMGSGLMNTMLGDPCKVDCVAQHPPMAEIGDDTRFLGYKNKKVCTYVVDDCKIQA